MHAKLSRAFLIFGSLLGLTGCLRGTLAPLRIGGHLGPHVAVDGVTFEGPEFVPPNFEFPPLPDGTGNTPLFELHLEGVSFAVRLRSNGLGIDALSVADGKLPSPIFVQASQLELETKRKAVPLVVLHAFLGHFDVVLDQMKQDPSWSVIATKLDNLFRWESGGLLVHGRVHGGPSFYGEIRYSKSGEDGWKIAPLTSLTTGLRPPKDPA